MPLYLLQENNYSLYSLFAYYLVTLYPHVYGVGLIRHATKRWNNANPRSVEWINTIEKSVTKELFAKFERCEAAHKNGLENFPVFASAIILGTMVKLPNDKMNILSGAFVALRILYAFSYITISRNKYSFIRSLLWVGSTSVCMVMFFMSANKVKNGLF